MDDLDRAILEKLCEDARLSQRKLAQLLGVAQGTVTKRMQRMEESGLIKNYAAVLDAEKVGWSMTIMAGLRIQKGRMIEVQEKIASDPRVFNVYDITGDWDSMVLARVKDRSDLDNLTKLPTSKLDANSLFSKPGKNVFFNFLKNSCKNNTDKLVTTEPSVWADAVVSSNTNFSLFTSVKDDESPTL